MPTKTIEFYGDSISGNCYKLQLACAELDIDYVWNEVDILAGAAADEAFLKMNPNGKVPLMVLPDGRYLAESNAILSYLAADSDLQSTDRYVQAAILQWMFFEQYSHEPYIATSRFIVLYLGSPEARQADLAAKQPGGYKALGVMEKQLESSQFIASDEFSIADIALYAYTHVAKEGGFELDDYPSVRQWLQRVAARPRHVPMRMPLGGHN